MKLVTALAVGFLIAACSAGGGAATATPGPASPTSAQPAGPPRGLLDAGGGEVVGFLGTFCWQGQCADVFDTPPAVGLPLLEASAGTLAFGLAGDAPFMSWSASYRADDADGMTTLAQGGADFDPDTNSTPPPSLSQASFDAPPPGDWVLIVQVFSEDGDAQYLWHIVTE